jgi:dTDP-4-dehydrorhamnose 3,5-epimerase
LGSDILNEIKITPLGTIQGEGGSVLHGVKKSDLGYVGFGEAYFSVIENNKIKAWKCHQQMTMNLVVPYGNVKFVFYGSNSNFKVIEIGQNNYQRITVPPNIWFGFQGRNPPYSLILNLANVEHDPTEVKRLLIDEIYFEW